MAVAAVGVQDKAREVDGKVAEVGLQQGTE